MGKPSLTLPLSLELLPVLISTIYLCNSLQLSFRLYTIPSSSTLYIQVRVSFTLPPSISLPHPFSASPTLSLHLPLQLALFNPLPPYLPRPSLTLPFLLPALPSLPPPLLSLSHHIHLQPSLNKTKNCQKSPIHWRGYRRFLVRD